MISIIEELSRTLAARWRAKGYREWEFASIAAKALQEFELHKRVERVLDHAFADDEGPLVRNHRSQDVACLHSVARFDICLHTWVDGLAPMHHHGWSGAYQLLSGSSVDAGYSFRQERRLAAGLSVGELRCRAIDDLSAGDVRPVEPGENHIHTLSYNESACLTISVRSRPIFGETTMDYWRPGLAIETLGDLDYIAARNKCVRYLSYADPSALSRRLRDWITTGDLRSVFLGLEALQSLPKSIPDAVWEEVVATGKVVHGSVFEVIAAAARESGRPHYQRRLLARTGAQDLDLRHFLSYLFVSPDRETCLARVQAGHALVTPFEKCQEWCRKILALENGADVVSAWEDGLLAVLDRLLVTGSAAAVMKEVESDYDVDEETRMLVRETCEQLRWHPAFGVLVGNVHRSQN